uniref:5-oxoprolinase n=1 Tax=Lygus hesperus TaxID=30085 RepID=A0A0K8SCA3_LYGHE
MSGKFCFAIDRGGTFTDIYAKCPDGSARTLKLLSVDPANYEDAPREGIRRIIEEVTGKIMPKNEKVDTQLINWIRMGTTVATNALLERKGVRTALIITKGFRDLLYIGNQSRPKIFDLEINTPEMLYEEVVEVNCRIVPQMEGKCILREAKTWPIVEGLSGEKFLVSQSLKLEEVKVQLMKVLAKGIKSIAVVLLHSYMYAQQEVEIGKLADELGFENVSLSHQVMPMVKVVNRGYTACADAYLTPHIQQYVKGFAGGFENDLKGVNVLFMQSDGGLTPMNNFNGSRAVLSGPAGGVVGYAATTPGDDPIIGFDMGGTSTDVSRYAGHYEHVFESTVAGITIQAPQLDINTVAAGGGSRLFFRSGLFVVGPESAGAHPGPVCYRKGGYLTVTDANLVLGRIIPQFFPSIFGKDEKQPLDKDATMAAFRELQNEINSFFKEQGGKPMSIEEIAMGFIRVANESMCRPIRALTQGKGYDTSTHILSCFGGAGGQHACAVARELGMSKVAVHKYAGILSAYGMACADVVHEEQEPSSLVLLKQNGAKIQERIKVLVKKGVDKLKTLGFNEGNILYEPFLNLRYEGTDGSLMIASERRQISSSFSLDVKSFEKSFLQKYESEFGFTIPERPLLIDDIRVRAVGQTRLEKEATLPKSEKDPIPTTETNVYFEDTNYVSVPVFLLKDLSPGHVLPGPAIIIDGLSTLVIEPQCIATVTISGSILIKVGTNASKAIGTKLDSIQLSIFSHRFMSIAEQMGRILQRTSISTNIKERLDFSCALFGPDGGLVSNAPHIPVHLGSMKEAVQFQIGQLGNTIRDGDVILSNHPKAGGSHLPDLTVITPVFFEGESKPVFYVASRGHHADIGGITPGSMPPHSKTLSEEGAAFISFFLVKKGRFREKELTEELKKPGLIPGSSGTRNLHDNIADLKAQIAANQKGITLVKELIAYYGLDVVQAYMRYIQEHAALAVRDMLRTIGKRELEKQGTTTLTASDLMDDGSPIKIKVDINMKDGSAVCDFTGSGHEVWGNCNAPRAITLSALIYCLRCMVGHDVPLNQGCLEPIKVVIPPQSILDPSEDAAVVGGNVQTSQRIVDVILKAFRTCAASQGCMNNITFGQDTWGYYETVAGGAGAGPSWHGRSGVHSHMTNTRITDPEILEKRYPVVLEAFHLRSGSGGNGLFKGGEGVVRVFTFRNKISLSILTERRVFHPYGMESGQPGAKGVNLLQRKNGSILYLGSKTAINVEPGEIFTLLTPGGGGWGSPEASNHSKNNIHPHHTTSFTPRGSLQDYLSSQESA